MFHGIVSAPCFMTEKQARLINGLVRISLDCFAYATYYRLIKDGGSNDWLVYTKSAYHDEAVINWCKIFGSYSEHTHYYTIVDCDYEFKENLLSMGLSAINQEAIKSWLLNKADVENAGFDAFHSKTKDYRDKNLIHFLHDPEKIKSGDLTYSELDIILNTSFAMIEFLKNLYETFPKSKDDKNNEEVSCINCSSKDELVGYFEKFLPANLKR